MKIPKTVKIGGKVYKVEITDTIPMGYDYAGQILYREQVIKILDTKNPEGMEETLMHEIIHGVYCFLGYDDHDEKKVSELSNALHMVIADNAEMFNG